MTQQKPLKLIIALILIPVLVIGCEGSAATPISQTSMATPTPAPPTNTPVPTATSIPPADTSLPTQTPELSTKILFIGESLISWNNGLDQNIEQLAASANPPLTIEADTVAIGRGSLEKMWKESKAAEVIGAGDYDVVVLQEDLWGTGISTFREYARKFDAEIKKTGAKTALFMAWQVSYLELTIEEIAQAHRVIATELGADVAPIGLAFEQAMAERPELKLVGPDGIHPSIHGTYLATNVMYATIFGQSPNSTAYLPAAPSHDCVAEEKKEESHDPASDAYAGKRVSGCVTEEEAAFLQRIAWETVQAYQAQP